MKINKELREELLPLIFRMERIVLNGGVLTTRYNSAEAELIALAKKIISLLEKEG